MVEGSMSLALRRAKRQWWLKPETKAGSVHSHSHRIIAAEREYNPSM
jgi:hypothetical protein